MSDPNGPSLLIAGLVVLAIGAEILVGAASRLAASLGIRPMILGLTVVAIGTSMPELAIGVIAGSQGSPGLAVGNIAGTNVVNILFILGLSALIKALPLHLRTIKLDLPVIVASALLMTLMAWDGVLSQVDGVLLVVGAVGFTVVLVRAVRLESRAVKAEFREMYGSNAPVARMTSTRYRVGQSALLLASMALTVLGADWLVDGAVSIARSHGIPETVVGLTVVAVGTSAPELVTMIVATLKNERDVAIGNLLGSSIYNILVILGLTCVLTPGGLAVERSLLLVDIPLMLGVAMLCVPVFVSGQRISRVEGGIFVTVYVVYVTSLVAMRT